MSPEQQRIKIAEACGWKRPDHPDVMKFKVGWTMPEKWWMSPKGVLELGEHSLPDYLNDLNAMHKTEKLLTTNQFDVYRCWLLKITFDGTFGGFRRGKHERDYICATAAQRAEAFLKALGLWEE